MVTNTIPVQTTAFFGRQAELTEISRLLSDSSCRLLTLVGLGGVGKTRLAVELAAQLTDAFPHGVYFVPLQPLQSHEQILHTLISVLQLPTAENPRSDLLAYLRERRSLLLFDNFEHLLDGAGLLVDILDAAPRVKVLVTSRQGLNLRYEWQRQVQGLPYIETNPGPADAVALFIDRAQRLRGDLDFTAQDDAVGQICRLVEGMPLALELAAGWVKVLSCSQIAEEIQNGLNILAARSQDALERHRSMQAVFDQSWLLLTAQEQAVLRRFSVFRGGATREAVEAVTGATLDDLAALVDVSLLRHDPVTGRYDMQELLRQYAAEQLDAGGETESTQGQHAAYFTTFLYNLVPRRSPGHSVVVLDTIEANLDNLLVAWHHTVAALDCERINCLIDGLRFLSESRLRILDAHTLFARAVAVLDPTEGELAQRVRGRLLARIGRGAFMDIMSLNEALAIARQYGDIEEEALCLKNRGYYYLYRDKITLARRDFDDALALFRQPEAGRQTLRGLVPLVQLYESIGDSEAAKACAQEGLGTAQGTSGVGFVVELLLSSARIACAEGDYQRAETFSQQAFDIAKGAELDMWIAWSLRISGEVAFWSGDLSRAKETWQTFVDTAPDGILELRNEVPCTQAMLANVQGDYQRAWDLGIQAPGILFPVSPAEQQAPLWMAVAACGLRNYAAARIQISTVPSEPRHLGVTLVSLIVGAAIELSCGAHERAVELLALAQSHPASPNGWLRNWTLIDRMRCELEAALGEAVYSAAWERGTHLDPMQVGHDLLAKFAAQSAEDGIAQANVALADPLTDRELEVLALIADGLSNPRIGERLYITTGTVKGHVNKILGKLNVRDRHQAVEQARDLGLIHNP